MITFSGLGINRVVGTNDVVDREQDDETGVKDVDALITLISLLPAKK